MPVVKFFYVLKNNSDGSADVGFYADKPTADTAREIEDRGNPFRNNGPFEIELEFDASGKLLSPDATLEELKQILLTMPKKEAAPVANNDNDDSMAARFTRTARGATSPAPAQDPVAGITSLAGKRVAFTGRIELSRPRMQELIRSVGAEVAGSVSESTDILVVGDDSGSIKVDKAREWGVLIVNEKQWNDMVRRVGTPPKPPAGLTA